MARGFKDAEGRFHPTEEFGIPRRSTKRKSVQTGVGRKQEIQMQRIQKRFPNDSPEPNPIGNISSLERMLAEERVDSEIDQVGFNDNLFEFENNQEWWIFDNFQDARKQAVEEEVSLLEQSPSVLDGILNKFTNDNFVFITETDKRMISSEEADMIASDSGLSEQQRDDLADEIEKKLDDPISYFINETGRYGSTETLLEQNFIRADIDAVAEFIVKTDGVGHTLSSYDGKEIVLNDKKGKERVYMYRRN